MPECGSGTLFHCQATGNRDRKYTAPSHYVDSVVGVMLEAMQH